ncbi:MAG: thioredoxin family protein [Elusimicrobiota bacterium]|nr:thioredoxin family protein [Elusimicrobiota bacterium]
MLQTNLEHIENENQFKELIEKNEKVAVCCGRMGPMCIPVYVIFETLQKEHPKIRFVDMDFDIPIAEIIKALPECRGFMGLPFTVYYRNGRVVSATTSIQSANQVKSILETVFA